MKLTFNDQNNLLKNFPKIELSYEKKLHNKVQTDIYLAIPKGKKYFAWFKTYKKYNLCILLEINSRRKSIEDMSVYTCCFDNILCAGKGTILYGTLITINKQN